MASPASAARRSFSCSWDGCDRAFARRSKLDTHVDGVHKKLRLFRCTDGCDKAFGQKASLRRHVAEFHEGRRHACSENGCDRSFGQRKSLTRHLQNVHATGGFVCDVSECSKGFDARHALRAHMEASHEGLRWECEVAGCGVSFGVKQSRVRHMRKFHLNEVVQSSTAVPGPVLSSSPFSAPESAAAASAVFPVLLTATPVAIQPVPAQLTAQAPVPTASLAAFAPATSPVSVSQASDPAVAIERLHALETKYQALESKTWALEAKNIAIESKYRALELKFEARETQLAGDTATVQFEAETSVVVGPFVAPGVVGVERGDAEKYD